MKTQRLLWSSIVAVGIVTTPSAQALKPTFEVAAVRKLAQPAMGPPRQVSPDRFYRSGDTLEYLIRLAYDVQRFQVVGGPDWVRSDRFEINAKAPQAVSRDEMRLMVQSLLSERFKLVVRKEQQELRFSALVVARDDGGLGPKLEKCRDPQNPPQRGPLAVPRGGMAFKRVCVPISDAVTIVGGVLGRPVVDKTGLAGFWSYQLSFSEAPDSNAPPISTALHEQLGLKLESTSGPVEVLVIESVQQPTEN